MYNEVKYDNEILTLLRKLSDINIELTIEKSEDEKEILITARTPSRSIAYEFKAPIDTFNFEGDDITFFDYKEFFTLFSVNDDPVIKQTENTFEIIKDRSKLTYFLAEKEATEGSEYDEYVEFDESHASFKLSAEKIKKFKTMIGLTNAEDLTFKVSGNKILTTLFYEVNQPTYEEEFDLIEPATKDFEFIVDTEIIKLAPENDYIIYLNAHGVIKLEYINDNDIELNLFIAESEDD
jgi:hypothetical protein